MIVLNMIVKNEEKIMLRLLESLVGFIDTFCIVDTGSTDGTVATIRSWNKIPGIVIDTEILFEDFGTTRTKALQIAQRCYPTATWILFLDADMVWKSSISPEDFRRLLNDKKQMTNFQWMLFQGDSSIRYRNARIVHGQNKIAYYWGVTHEYLDPGPCITEEIPSNAIFIEDKQDGGCKENKYTRDLELLLRGIDDEERKRECGKPGRYYFYTGNTYFNLGEIDKVQQDEYWKHAITYYEKCRNNFYNQETWFAFFRMVTIFRRQKNETKMLHWLQESLAVDQYRVEAVYEVICYYLYDVSFTQNQMKFYWAWTYILMAEKMIRFTTNTSNFLFYNNAISDYRIMFEKTVVAFYVGEAKSISTIHMIHRFLSLPIVPPQLFHSCFVAYQFYCPALMDILSISTTEMISPTTLIYSGDGKHRNVQLYEEGYYANVNEHRLYPITPCSLISSFQKESPTVFQRFATYKLSPSGEYINPGFHVRSMTCHNGDLWWLDKDTVLCAVASFGHRYEGIEDLRVVADFLNPEIQYFTGNTFFGHPTDPNMVITRVVIGKMAMSIRKVFFAHIMIDPETDAYRGCEKNWTLLPMKTNAEREHYSSVESFETFVPFYILYSWDANHIKVGTLSNETCFSSQWIQGKPCRLFRRLPEEDCRPMKSCEDAIVLPDMRNSSHATSITDSPTDPRGCLMGHYVLHDPQINKRTYYHSMIHYILQFDASTKRTKILSWMMSPLFRFHAATSTEYLLSAQIVENDLVLSYSVRDNISYIMTVANWKHHTVFHPLRKSSMLNQVT